MNLSDFFLNKYVKHGIFLMLLCGYLMYALMLDFTRIDQGYHVTVWLPVIYLLCLYLFMWDVIWTKKTPFLIMFLGVSFIRYVVLSMVTLHEGTYLRHAEVPVSDNNLRLAASLMAWEIVCVSIVIALWGMKQIKKTNKNQQNHTIDQTKHRPLYSEGNVLIYLLYIAGTILLMLLAPTSFQGLSFFSEINYAMNEEIGSILILGIRELFINAKYMFLFVIIILVKRMRKYDQSFVLYWVVIVVCLVVIGLRIGANRKKLLVDAISCALLLWHLFPRYRKSTIITLAAVGVSMVVATTIYRGMTSSSTSFFTDYFNLEFLQPYFLGQYNVGIAIEAYDMYGEVLTWKSPIFQVLRPLFGIGPLIKDWDVFLYKSLFDSRYSAGRSFPVTYMINPLIGEGYMMFGLLGAPILSIIVTRYGLFLDELHSRNDRIEVFFITTSLAFFASQLMILNSLILLNSISYRLSIYIPVVVLSYVIKGRRKHNERINQDHQTTSHDLIQMDLIDNPGTPLAGSHQLHDSGTSIDTTVVWHRSDDDDYNQLR